MVIKEILGLFPVSEGMHSKLYPEDVFRYSVRLMKFPSMPSLMSVDFYPFFSPFNEISHRVSCYSVYVLNFIDRFAIVKPPCIPGRKLSSKSIIFLCIAYLT